jgi:hypothetical protein
VRRGGARAARARERQRASAPALVKQTTDMKTSGRRTCTLMRLASTSSVPLSGRKL